MKYFHAAVLREKKTELMTIKQTPGETIQDYMGRFQRLLQYASGITDTVTDQVHYYVEGLLPEIGG